MKHPIFTNEAVGYGIFAVGQVAQDGAIYYRPSRDRNGHQEGWQENYGSMEAALRHLIAVGAEPYSSTRSVEEFTAAVRFTAARQ